jgi:CheY-like chemotaxis protein
MTSHGFKLAGQRVLIVEDEMMVGLLEEDLLLRAGCEVVGPVATVAEALQLVSEQRLDGAVLDVNLGQEPVYPVADRLSAAGIPFVFVTGYGLAGVADAYQRHATIQKPFNSAGFAQDVAAAFHGWRRADEA